MKPALQTLCATLCATLLLATGTPALALQLHTPVLVDATRSATVNAGETFFIALPSNVTTGYSWSTRIADPRIVANEGNVYQPPAHGLMGAGGEQIFVLHANRSGTTTLTFTYAAPFNPNQSGGGYTPMGTTFTVTVR